MAQIFKAKTLVSSTGRFSYEATAPNLIYNTGDQIISGNKFFVDNINVSGSGIFNALDLNNIDNLTISGVDISIINGEVNLTNRPTVNGTGVLLSGEAASLPTTIVYTTGDQIISGNKSFYGDMLLSGDNNRIGKSQYIETDNDFVFIKDSNGKILLSTEDYSFFDFDEIQSINWAYRNLVNQNGTPVLYWTGNNIGIGTNNPSEKLEVVGNIKADGASFDNIPTVNGTNVLLSGDAIISGDLTGYLPHPTISKLQGYKVDLSAAPADGQILQWNAASSSWRAGAVPAGGNGGGGLVYYFDFANRTGIAPTGGLPTTGDHALSLLGREYAVGSGQAISNELDPRFVERLLCSFVTASGNPQVTNIPAGLWDFNIWASVNSASAIQCSIRAVVNIYNPTNSTYRYLASTDDVYLYETDTIAQYILNATVPQTGIASNERIYIQLFGKKYTTNNRNITIYFDSYRPSHVHTTIPSVAGNGVVKVINGVFQSPATGIFDNDVDNNANISQSKIANLSSDLNDIRSTGIALNNKINSLSGTLTSDYLTISSASSTYATITNLGITGSTLASNLASTGSTLSTNLASTGSTLQTNINNLSGYINSSASNIVFTTGNQNISGVKTFNTGLSTTYISGVSGSSLNIIGFSGEVVSSSANRTINIQAGHGPSGIPISAGSININAGNALNTSANGGDITLRAGNSTNYFSNAGSINLIAGTGGLGFATPVGINLYGGPSPNYNGANNIFGNVNVNYNGSAFSTIAPKTISIYRSGNMPFGPSFLPYQQLGVLIDNNKVDVNNGMVLQVSGVQVTPSLYATSADLASTGSTLVTNLASTGSTLQTNINTLTTNLATTGFTLNTKINSLSGSSVLLYSDQSISGIKTFNNDVVFTGTAIFNQIDLSDTDSILLSGVNIQIVSGSITLTNMPTISGKPLITGVDLSSYLTSAAASSTYATITNLAGTGSTLATNLASTGSTLSTNLNTTGSTLSNKIDSLSGSSVLLYGNQSIGGVKTFRDNVYINNLYVTGTETIVNTSQINLASNYLLLNITGGAVDGGIFFVTGSGLTGVNDTGPIIGFDHSNKFKFGISTRNSDLSPLPDIASVQQLVAYSGVADAKFGTITNLNLTGSNLNTKIDNLSGYINSTSSNIVFTTGDQTISGEKQFQSNETVFGNNSIGLVRITDDSYGGEFGMITNDDEVIAVKMQDGSFQYGGGIPGNAPIRVNSSGTLNVRNNLIFSRDNSVTTGTAVSFTKTNGGSQVDYIEYPVSLTRGAIGPLYNPWQTSYFANDTTNIDYASPRYTRWNIDGWGDLTNVRSRKYDNFLTVLQNQIGNYIVGAELIMYDSINNKYYLFKFSSWQGGGGGGGFSYVRSLISFNDPEISKISGYLAVAENTSFDSSVGFNGPVLFEGDTNHYGSNRFYGTNYFSNPSYFTSDITATGGTFTINHSYTNLNSNTLNIKANNNNISLNDGFDKNLDQFLYSITLTGAGITEANGVWTRPSGGNTPFTNGQAGSNLFFDTNDNIWRLDVYSAYYEETANWYVNYYKQFIYGFNSAGDVTVPTITNKTWRSKNINGTNILANIGEVVLLTGNQTISGIKSFADNTVFGDPSQDNFLVISGNNFTVYGSGNFTSGLFVNGTGVLLSGQATQVDLGSTVRTTGNQTVSGVKNFQSVPLVSGKEIYFQKDIVYSSGISFTPNYVSGRNFVYQLTGFATTYNTINNPINIPEGETIIIKVIQSNYGNNFLNFGNNYRFPADASPLITQASGKFDIFNILKLDNRFITTYIKNFSN
jgi:hypothetical protein